MIMTTFRAFLTEQQAINPEAFPFTRHSLRGDHTGQHWFGGDKVLQNFDKMISSLNAALQEPGLSATRVTDIRSYTVGRTLDDVVRNGVPTPVMDWCRANYREFDYTSFIPGHIGLIKSKLAAADKAFTKSSNPYLQWLIPILREWVPISAACETLKTRIVARTPKAPEARNAYVAPFVKSDAGAQIYKVLQTLTDDLKDAYAAAVTKYLEEMAHRYVALPPAKNFSERSNRSQSYQQVLMIRGLWKPDSLSGTSQPTLTDNFREVLVKAGHDAAKDMQERFLYKSSRKLKAIVDAKGMGLADDPKILRATAGQGVFEGDILIRFTDQSEFRVTNKVVLKINHFGTVFNQYPTTFHDVRMPDGSKMGQPSEERMNEVFAKASRTP